MFAFRWPEMMCSKFSPADAPGESGSKASKAGASFWWNSEARPLSTLGDRALSRRTTFKLPSVMVAVGTASASLSAGENDEARARAGVAVPTQARNRRRVSGVCMVPHLGK